MQRSLSLNIGTRHGIGDQLDVLHTERIRESAYGLKGRVGFAPLGFGHIVLVEARKFGETFLRKPAHNAKLPETPAEVRAPISLFWHAAIERLR